LGHQLLGMALDFSTFKLPFGHRGGNHPVRELASGKVSMTSQNHGYCLQPGEKTGTTVPTHINLNDGTLEGLENRDQRLFSVQYHPEAAPGPRDSINLFKRFMAMMQK
ncbi:MAG TPA: carbamoyl phosphate synthase small subunit, partial [Firmicutes bacterium]|nr:carbamoyl phosphate synthase small subunit [Bacillota bacterium]